MFSKSPLLSNLPLRLSCLYPSSPLLIDLKIWSRMFDLLLVVPEADDRFLADRGVGGHEPRRKRLLAGLVVPRQHELLLLVAVHRLEQLEHHRFGFALASRRGRRGPFAVASARRRATAAAVAPITRMKSRRAEDRLGDRAGFALGAGRGLVGGHALKGSAGKGTGRGETARAIKPDTGSQCHA